MKIRILLLPLLIAVASGCSTLGPYSFFNPPPINADTNLCVGVSSKYPPIIYKDHGEIKGMEADFALKLGEELDLPVTFIPLRRSKLIEALEDGTVDIVMAGVSITTGREQLASFCDPYLRIGQLAVVMLDARRNYRVPESLIYTQDRIGVQEATTGDLFVREHCIQAERVTFKSPRALEKAFLAGKVEVMIHDAPTIWSVAARNETRGVKLLPWKLTNESLAWAVQRDNDALREKANESLRKWQDSGFLNETIRKWIPIANQRRRP